MGIVSRAEATRPTDCEHGLRASCAWSSFSIHELTTALHVATPPASRAGYPLKIATATTALARVAALQRPRVLTNGVFDILHPRPCDVPRAGGGLGAVAP